MLLAGMVLDSPTVRDLFQNLMPHDALRSGIQVGVGACEWHPDHTVQICCREARVFTI